MLVRIDECRCGGTGGAEVVADDGVCGTEEYTYVRCECKPSF